MTLEPLTPSKAAGSRPTGARDERESAARVRDMFSDIAPRYDLLNHLLSFSLDHRWRRLTAEKFRRIYRRTDARILDLCCGTGDLAFALDAERVDVIRDSTAHRVPIIGCDFALPMVERAKRKARSDSHSAIFVGADALKMPFADASFDLVTTAFGFRNLANYEQGLLEIARILRPGGKLAILEFSEPRNTAIAAAYRLYFKRILPFIGGIVSGNGAAYAYLPSSVAKFPTPLELAALMRKTGFTEIRYESWNFGSVVLHTGRTPAPEKPIVEVESELEEEVSGDDEMGKEDDYTEAGS
ncbi:MAG: bifunctional demethylmenaquinone methyltransferase/2-methoxy-6-polyprenyl-1,4-benzoquinol methylase UbiE [Candidatus Acidiferrales bacterium]